MTNFRLAMANQTLINGGGCCCNGGLLLYTGAAFAVFGGCTKAVALIVPPNATATAFVFGAAASTGIGTGIGTGTGTGTGTGATVDVLPTAGAFGIVGACTDAVSVIINIVAVADECCCCCRWASLDWGILILKA